MFYPNLNENIYFLTSKHCYSSKMRIKPDFLSLAINRVFISFMHLYLPAICSLFSLISQNFINIHMTCHFLYFKFLKRF
jgi:hypothetical protein